MCTIQEKLSKITELKEIDEDMLEYVSSMLESTNEENKGKLNLDIIQNSIGEILMQGLGLEEDDDAQLNSICKKILDQFPSNDEPVATNTTATVSNGRQLNTPVRLGDSSAITGSGMVDFMWGKNDNAYLRANRDLQFSDKEQARDRKRQERYAKKDQTMKAAEMRKAGLNISGTPDASNDATVLADVSETTKSDAPAASGDVHLRNITLGFDGAPLIENAEARLVRGRRYGLVGRNGFGKSTFLRAFAKKEIEGMQPNLRIAVVQQEIRGTTTNVLETVLQADIERTMLLEREQSLMSRLSDGEASATESDKPMDIQRELEKVTAKLESIDAFGAEARAASILSGLSFTSEMQHLPTSALSGGWRMRVALACALFMQHDVLLLDEPTNHLDFPSVAWLENHLNKYPDDRILIVVSHDRHFLNTVATDIIHLHRRTLVQYRGDYDTFESTRSERAKHALRASERAEHQKKHMQSFIDKFRFNAKRASLVQSRLKAVERLEAAHADDADNLAINTDNAGSVVKFLFPDPGPLGPSLVQIRDVTFSYDGDTESPLLKDVNFGVDMHSRLAILGPNGVGKTTLLKVLLGKLQPNSGDVSRNGKLRISTFTQHHIDQLDLTATPLSFLQAQFPSAKIDDLRAHLGRFGLSGDLALQCIGTLSGGQKSRVAFAQISWNAPHLLILDEPTNHLDLETIDGLIVALTEFPGAVIVVSHDRHFISALAEDIWVVGHPVRGRVSKFGGDIEDYIKVAHAEDFQQKRIAAK